MKKKGIITAKEAAYKAFQGMSDVFHGSEVSFLANFLMQRPNAYVDTTMRKLRLLRSEGVIDFECIHKMDSKYRKIDIN